ncbi:MAG TPA: cupin domain-containing protein [Thermoanaerobaculia bacterium]|nr:cupin domain-containing protein [Thermoanaerobaculia bacterium]
MKQVISTLEALLGPVTPQTFLRDFWERNYLHIRRDQRGLFESLFSLRDLDSWLRAARTGPADSVLTTPPAGSEEGAKRCRPEDVKVEEIYDLFAKGHSVVLNYLENSWPPLFALIKSLGKSFAASIGVNMYLTPKGSKTFALHTDDHDVFVLQVQGEKEWRLHELRTLAVMRLDYKQDLAFTPDWGGSRLEGPLLEELTLRPGDVLYVPRGMPHCAIAKDSTSLHLTVSITPLYWIDFLKAAVEQAAVHATALRRALPIGFVEQPAATEAMRHGFSDALRAFQENLSFESTVDVLIRNRVRIHGYPQDGHFAQLTALENLGLDSELERREGILCAVHHFENKFSNIRFGTRHVRGPARLRQAFEFIRDTDRFRVSEIPGLDDQSRLVIARRLIREGLLRFAEPQPVHLEVVARSA